MFSKGVRAQCLLPSGVSFGTCFAVSLDIEGNEKGPSIRLPCLLKQSRACRLSKQFRPSGLFSVSSCKGLTDRSIKLHTQITHAHKLHTQIAQTTYTHILHTQTTDKNYTHKLDTQITQINYTPKLQTPKLQTQITETDYTHK